MKKCFLFLFAVALINNINSFATDSTLFVAGPDTFTIDMSQPGLKGDLYHNGTIYIFPGVAQSTDLYVKLGPVDEPGASYKVLQSPDMNTFVSYIRKVDMQGRWGFRKTISSVNYDAYFNVMRPDSMKKTPKLSGNDSICSSNEKYTITIDSVNTASTFKWFVSPDSAGSISDTDTVATLKPNPNYTGKIQIRVLARFFSFGVETTPALSNPVELFIIKGPQSGFDAVTGATKFKMDFTNSSVNADSYDLDYGDGSSHFTGAAFTPQTHSYTSMGNYTVTLVTQKGACRDTLSEQVSVWVVEAIDNADNSISVFPNPSSDKVLITINENAKDLFYALYSVNGNIIMKGILRTDDLSIDISSLAIGTYLLEIDKKVFKIVKE